MLLLLVALGCLSTRAAAQPSGRTTLNFNVGWKFYLGTPDGMPQAPEFNDSAWQSVSVPHSLKLTSADLDGTNDDFYQKTFLRYECCPRAIILSSVKMLYMSWRGG